MKRTLAIITHAAALVVLTGLLDGVATAASASSPKLSAKLLSIGQMPTGWSVYNGSSNGLGCLANTLEPKGVKQTAKASVAFEDNGNLPDVVERLATFTNAKTGYKKIDANLTACKHLSGTSDGQKFSGTVGQMSFPHYGNASAAFAANFTNQVTRCYEDIVIVREASIVMEMVEGNLAPVSLSQFQGFVKKAIKKVV